MSNFTRIVKTKVKVWKFLVQDVILWNLTVIFSGSHKKFSLEFLQMTNNIFSPWKMFKKTVICFKLFWYKEFMHWKLKLLNFLVGSVSISCKPTVNCSIWKSVTSGQAWFRLEKTIVTWQKRVINYMFGQTYSELKNWPSNDIESIQETNYPRQASTEDTGLRDS